MGRMAIMLKQIKDNKDMIEEAKTTLNTDKLPPGLIGDSRNKEETKEHIQHFLN